MIRNLSVLLLVFIFGLLNLTPLIASAKNWHEEGSSDRNFSNGINVSNDTNISNDANVSSDTNVSYDENQTDSPITDVTSDGSACCCPKGPIGLILDKNYSPYVGGSGLISLWRIYMSLDDYFFPNSEGDTNAYTMLARTCKLTLEDLAVSAGMVTQHEIFGHGWRAREFNLPVFAYSVQPYRGYTEFSKTKFNLLTPSEKIAFIAGGMEATGILAKQLRDRWLETKSIDEREGHFYLITSLDQTLYVMRTKQNTTGFYENDVQAYVQQVNNWYGRTVLTPQRLRSSGLIDLLDPYLWFSLFGLGHYIFDGTQCFEYPMLPIGDYQYLPGFRLALAPYGPEYQLINYIRGPDYTLQATLRYGNTGGKNSGGLILEMARLWAVDCLSVDGRLDMWSQPKLFVATADQARRTFGGAASLFVRYRLFNNFEIMGQAGYKTKGYIPGESLRRGPILRAGFFIRM